MKLRGYNCKTVNPISRKISERDIKFCSKNTSKIRLAHKKKIKKVHMDSKKSTN